MKLVCVAFGGNKIETGIDKQDTVRPPTRC